MRAAPRMVGMSLVAASLTSVACASQAASDTMPSGSDAPIISRLSPATGPAGQAYPIRLTIHGRGFDDVGNRVTFGSVSIDGVPSTEGGTRITVSVPKATPATGEVPPMVLVPGEYAVTVTTPAGTSNPLSFTLVRPGNP